MRRLIMVILVACLPACIYAQKVLSIWPNGAPGSADWNWKEGQTYSKAWKGQEVFNVVNPTLALYAPDAGTANGTSIIVCPGGGFYALSIDNEGTEVAKWLAKKGITVFLLRYRLVHTVTDDAAQEFSNTVGDPAKLKSIFEKIIPLAVADGKQAISFVRSHAAEYHIDPKKIGIIGFSAGGTVASAAAYNYTSENRPDFVAPIYAYVPPGGFGEAPKDGPPVFLAIASDDSFKLVPSTLDMYNKWLNAHLQVEMHIYSKGGHGFGMHKQNSPVDGWIERFADWLQFNGLIK